ncbi:acyl-CoA dehydrogenase family protein, partial [Salmonella enterica]|uniref:acyl-CoA dehydrogenase family protein n=1 Tax=Salmonella enterica TaxID=28901 RepID=UPI003CEE3C5A
GVVVPEAYGGSEFGYLSLGLVLEEMGRTLVASPLIASALAAASALAMGGSEAQKSAWLPKIATGEAVATLAVDEGPRHDPLRTALGA